MHPAGWQDSSHSYLQNPLTLLTLLVTPFGTISAKFLWGRSKRHQGSWGAPEAFLLMATLLGQHWRAKALQLPFPGAGGEGNAAEPGLAVARAAARSGSTRWQPLPLLRIVKPLPQGAAGSWRGGMGRRTRVGGGCSIPARNTRAAVTYHPHRDVWMPDASVAPWWGGQPAALSAMCWEISRPARELVLAQLTFTP